MPRYVLFTYPDPQHSAEWLDLPEEVRQAGIAEHGQWFSK